MNASTPREAIIYDTAAHMSRAGLAAEFVERAVCSALRFEGVSDLLELWMEAPSTSERDEIIADLTETLDDIDHAPSKPLKLPHVRFDDLEKIGQDVRAFKDSLRLLVDQRGGISHLAELTGMPQPSLSRFFNSASMPRRATLLKIANALELSEVEIASEWAR